MNTRTLVFLAIAGIAVASCCNCTSELVTSDEATVVQTVSGKVAGYIDEGIFTYKGIPYAKAERFMSPVPADPWE